MVIHALFVLIRLFYTHFFFTSITLCQVYKSSFTLMSSIELSFDLIKFSLVPFVINNDILRNRILRSLIHLFILIPNIYICHCQLLPLLVKEMRVLYTKYHGNKFFTFLPVLCQSYGVVKIEVIFLGLKAAANFYSGDTGLLFYVGGYLTGFFGINFFQSFFFWMASCIDRLVKKSSSTYEIIYEDGINYLKVNLHSAEHFSLI